MSTPKILAGKRIAVLAADGFEQAQLDIPVAALAEGGAAVTLVSLRRGRIRGMHLHQPGELVRVDEVIATAQAADHDGLFIPGGYVCPDSLRQSAPARAFVREFDVAAKPIAVLAQAPLVLVSAGLAAGRTLAAWPGIRDDLVNAGATWRNDDVVRDAHLLSGRGAHDLTPFVQAMTAMFAGEPAAAAAPCAPSDPPQDSPLEQPNQSLRWLAAPSFGTMLSLALLGVGVVAAQRVRHRQASADPPAPEPDASARARD
jgi:protease I